MYIIHIVGAVAGNIEIPSLNCLYKAYQSFDEAVKECEAEINKTYANNDSFSGFKMQLPKIAYLND